MTLSAFFQDFVQGWGWWDLPLGKFLYFADLAIVLGQNFRGQGGKSLSGDGIGLKLEARLA